MNRTWLIGLILFIGGAIGMFFSLYQTELNHPSTAWFTWDAAYLISLGIGSYLTANQVISRFIQSENALKITVGILSVVLFVASIAIPLVIYESLKSRDLETNGSQIYAPILKTEFAWRTDARDESLYFGFTYRYSVNDRSFEFTHWDEVNDHNFTYKENPVVDDTMIDMTNFYHSGDTLSLIVSTKNPSWHKIQ
jgi:hypothetical protein